MWKSLIDAAVLTERIKHIEERITMLGVNYAVLTKSYNVLNDHHHTLEMNVMQLDTKLSTCVSLIKWLISPAMIIALILELARLSGVIQ